MKTSLLCPKCKHNRILHVTQVADNVLDVDPKITEGLNPAPEAGRYFPLRIARLKNPGRTFFTVETAAAGVVEAFVCKACGYTELYTRGVEQIPVDGDLVRELVGPEPSGPYR